MSKNNDTTSYASMAIMLSAPRGPACGLIVGLANQSWKDIQLSVPALWSIID